MTLFGESMDHLLGLIIVITIACSLMFSFKIYQKSKGNKPEIIENVTIGEYINKNIDLTILSKKIQDFLYLHELVVITSSITHKPEFKEEITASNPSFLQSNTVKIIISGTFDNFTVIGDFSSLKSSTHNSMSMRGSAIEKKSLKLKNQIIEAVKCFIQDMEKI